MNLVVLVQKGQGVERGRQHFPHFRGAQGASREHLCERQRMSFDDSYFDEICSPQLLAVLEAAQPALREREVGPTWVMPAATVRAAVRHDRVTHVHYPPWAATRRSSGFR